MVIPNCIQGHGWFSHIGLNHGVGEASQEIEVGEAREFGGGQLEVNNTMSLTIISHTWRQRAE